MHLKEGTYLQGEKYQIVRRISSGGFGITYEGKHTKMDTRVAIKEFFPKMFCSRDEGTSHVTVSAQDNRDKVERLRRKFNEEAKAIYQMKHDNIVRVSDIFDENGTAYYVMDYIEGSSLHNMVKERGSLPEAEAVGYIRQVADALKYVHSLNRLHLDIKPGNIMVDMKGGAILIDFGASKHYDQESGENTSTLLGLNTKGYAPPEQSTQSFSSFSPATDIYALGATLYKLLTGITPPDSTLLAIKEESLQPLPDSISKRTRNAVISAMSVERKDRPQSASAFLELLGDVATARKSEKPKKNKTNSEMRTSKREDTDDESTVFQNSRTHDKSAEGHQPDVTAAKKSQHISSAIIAVIICVIIIRVLSAALLSRPTTSVDVQVSADDISPQSLQEITPQITIEGKTSLNVNFSSDACDTLLKLSKNFEQYYEYSDTPSWIHIHTGTEMLRIFCDKNTDSTPRRCTVEIYKEGSSVALAKLTVYQERARVKESTKNAARIEMQRHASVEGNVGEQFSCLEYKIVPQEADWHEVRWSSSNNEVASIYEDLGIITIKKSGKTDITAMVDGVSATCVVDVKIKSEKKSVIPEKSSMESKQHTTAESPSSATSTRYAKINKSDAGIGIGETIQLSINNYDGAIGWSSSSPDIAKVNGNGLVTGISEGRTTIWANLHDGTLIKCNIQVSASSKVSRSDENPANTVINKTSLSLELGESFVLYATGNHGTVSWKSDNGKVATVSSSGLVTAVGVGSTNIWAIVNGQYKRCLVTVSGSTDFKPWNITGRITNANGEPIVGAIVMVKGTPEGTVSDLNGRYSIDAKKGDILVFSYVRLKGKEITVQNGNKIDVTLTKQ